MGDLTQESTMTNNNSLVCAYILNGKGGGTKIGWAEIINWQPNHGPIWIHLDFTKTKTQTWLLKESGLDKHTAKAMCADESRPRCVFLDETLYLCLRGVNTNPGQEPEDMVSIRLHLTKNRIISTRKRKLISVQDVCDKIESGNGPKNNAELMLFLNDRITYRISEAVANIEDELDGLEEQVIGTESRLLRPKLAELRRQVTMIRRYLAPQREALYRLQVEKTPLLTKTNQSHLRESTDRLIRFIEDLDTIRDRATITQEELSSRVTEQMDQRMYALSVVAMIFLPLTFVTGLLGINTGGIPGAENKMGFLITCVILLAMGGLTIMALRYKKWM